MPFLFFERKPDHPRGCGEHFECYSVYYCDMGSSPRMRGALVRSPESTFIVRIIPADAGSTCVSWLYKALCKDHPRGCGEHALAGSADRCRLGSSPRMRGAH